MIMTLLLVDDSVEVRELIRMLFREDTIHECSDGEDALAMFARYRPDWVFMDVKMRKVDGVAATRAITEGYPGARVIIVTQYDDPVTRHEAAAAGAMHYVLKEEMYTLPEIVASEDARRC
jgi:two-component system response regulator YesN